MTGPPTDASGPAVRFFDDFVSGGLDRSRWQVRTTGKVVNDEQQAYVDSPETIYVTGGVAGADGNVLVIHPRLRPGHTTADGRRFDFVSGRIDTRDRFGFVHGTAAARIRLPAGAGLWPAFWALGEGRWPDAGEIDVMECVGEPDWVSSAVHGPGYSGEAGLVNRRYFPDGEDATGWHVYSVEREPGRITFAVDGTVVYRVTRPMVEFFGRWAFGGEMFLVLNLALGGTYPFKTNGVRVPFYGLPGETVEAIRRGRAAMMVDWVRVTAPAADPHGEVR